MKRIYTLLFVSLIAFAASAQDLTILHLNDTHSHIDPQRGGKNPGQGGVIEQAAFVDSVRLAVGKKNVLLVHAGDFSQGTSYFTELGGDIEIDILPEPQSRLSIHRIFQQQYLFLHVENIYHVD